MYLSPKEVQLIVKWSKFARNYRVDKSEQVYFPLCVLYTCILSPEEDFAQIYTSHGHFMLGQANNL